MKKIHRKLVCRVGRSPQILAIVICLPPLFRGATKKIPKTEAMLKVIIIFIVSSSYIRAADKTSILGFLLQSHQSRRQNATSRNAPLTSQTQAQENIEAVEKRTFH